MGTFSIRSGCQCYLKVHRTPLKAHLTRYRSGYAVIFMNTPRGRERVPCPLSEPGRSDTRLGFLPPLTPWLFIQSHYTSGHFG